MPSKLDVLAAGEILFGLLDAGIVALAGEIADEVAQLKERYRYECNGYCRVSPCIGDPECRRQTESGLHAVLNADDDHKNADTDDDKLRQLGQEVLNLLRHVLFEDNDRDMLTARCKHRNAHHAEPDEHETVDFPGL